MVSISFLLSIEQGALWAIGHFMLVYYLEYAWWGLGFLPPSPPPPHTHIINIFHGTHLVTTPGLLKSEIEKNSKFGENTNLNILFARFILAWYNIFSEKRRNVWTPILKKKWKRNFLELEVATWLKTLWKKRGSLESIDPVIGWLPVHEAAWKRQKI